MPKIRQLILGRISQIHKVWLVARVMARDKAGQARPGGGEHVGAASFHSSFLGFCVATTKGMMTGHKGSMGGIACSDKSRDSVCTVVCLFLSLLV